MRRAIVLAQVSMFVLGIGCHAHDRIIGLDGGSNAGAAVMSGGPSGTAGAGTAGTNASTMPSTAHDAGMRTGSRVPEGTAGADANAPGNAGAPAGSDVSADGGEPATSDPKDAAIAEPSDASTPPSPATGCTALMQCCAQLSNAERLSCDLIATNSDNPTCNVFQPLLCDSSTPDAGVDSCSTLDDCCATLAPGEVRAACANTAMGDTKTDCAQAKDTFCPDGIDLTACITLSACCDGLPPPKRKNCNAIVEAGLPSACQTAQATDCR
jgi:hypothetical protein